MAEKDGENGVAAGSRVRMLSIALLFDVLLSERPVVAGMRSQRRGPESGGGGQPWEEVTRVQVVICVRG